MNSILHYDKDDLRAQATRRFGTYLGEIAAAAEIQRREQQDVDYYQMAAKLAALDEEISNLGRKAEIAQQLNQIKVQLRHEEYITACNQAAADQSAFEQQIGPRRQAMLDVQRAMFSLLEKRETERNLQEFSSGVSAAAGTLQSDRTQNLSSQDERPPSLLAMINAGASKIINR